MYLSHGTSGWKFDGTIVEPDCESMAEWFECRRIDEASGAVRRGYEYFHHTSSTLGPNGTAKFEDGTPYASTVTACSSCHFTGGQVPYGTPVYQSPGKYANLPYFRPLNYRRDLRVSILDCFSNCMNNQKNPEKDAPVMDDLVAFIEWVADGITDDSMKGNGWLNLPGRDALHLAVHINDQERAAGLADTMYCHTDADGIPASLRKPAAWNVGCIYPGEPFAQSQILHGPWSEITTWRNAEINRLLAQGGIPGGDVPGARGGGGCAVDPSSSPGLEWLLLLGLAARLGVRRRSR
jgi:MYXO-CTERM domain-containing protein